MWANPVCSRWSAKKKQNDPPQKKTGAGVAEAQKGAVLQGLFQLTQTGPPVSHVGALKLEKGGRGPRNFGVIALVFRWGTP